MEVEKEKTKNKMEDANVLVHQSLYTAQEELRAARRPNKHAETL